MPLVLTRRSGNPLELRLGIAHSLGYILGQKLYLGLISGRIEQSAVRDLFQMPFTSGRDVETACYYLVKRLA